MSTPSAIPNRNEATTSATRSSTKALFPLGAALGAALLLAVLWFIYAPALRGGWLWDDDREITDNPALRDPAAPAAFWLRPAGADYFPLKDTVQWAEWKLWGDHPAGYHLAGLLLQAANSLLLWRVLRRLFAVAGPGGSRAGNLAAWFGALVFAVHPLAVESVAWISELKNTLSLIFLLAAFDRYLAWDEERAAGAYLAAWGLFLAALLCKTSVVMFPLIILLYAAWRRGRVDRREIWASLPFFAASLILGFVTMRFQYGQAILPGGSQPGSWPARIALAGLALSFYLFKAVWPAGLLPIYPAWSLQPLRLWQFLPWAGLALAVFGLWRRRGGWGRHVLFGLGVFALNLAPVAGLVRFSYMRFGWVADHFAYLSLTAVGGLAAAGLGAALQAREGRGRAPVLAVAALLSALLAGLARRHAGLYGDPARLWSYTLRNNPGSWTAENNLATALVLRGHPDEALAHFTAALRLNPGAPETENDLGTTLLSLGRPEEAAAHLARAVRLYPDFAEARYNLGNALLQTGRAPEAAEQYEAALRIEPGVVEVLGNLGLALARAGRVREAVERYREALRVDPRAAPILDDLGDAELLLRHPDAAVPQYVAALRRNPDDAEAQCGWGNALLMEGRTAEAIPHLEAALRAKPDFENARQNLEAARRALSRPAP